MWPIASRYFPDSGFESTAAFRGSHMTAVTGSFDIVFLLKILPPSVGAYPALATR